MQLLKKIHLILFTISGIHIVSHQYQQQTVECLSLSELPPKFNDAFLPKGQRDGQYIEHLGHILKLDTYLPPKHIDQYETTLILYNRRTHNPKEIIFGPNKFCVSGNCAGPFQYDLLELSNSGYNPNLKTIIMIPGFLTNDNVPWMNNAMRSWLQLEDVNVILVTWKNSNRYMYSTAVADTPLVARQITIYLHYLAELHGHQLMDNTFARSLHFVAHSLGAHVAAYVGQDLAGKVSRITGLDPAGPSFDMMPRSRRLDITDAQFVDIIHTNAGKMHYANLAASSLLETTNYVLKKLPIISRVASYFSSSYQGDGDTAWYGIDAKLGHIDYYANNGQLQPGCTDLLRVCDHGRATDILEDILDHEVELTRSKRDRNNNRLMAFRANDYEDFISGKSLARKCPTLLDGSRRQSAGDLKKCTLPIDLLKSADELLAEFNFNHGLQIGGSIYSTDSYYFTTNTDRPLVNDQFLLKIGLSDWTDWRKNCALKIEISLNNGSQLIQFDNEQLPVVRNDNFFGLAIPFISSSNKRARSLIEQQLTDEKTNEIMSTTGTWWQLEELVRLFPSKIQLTITSGGSKGLIAAAKKQITKLLTFGYYGGDQAPSQCRLYISSLEVIPIIENQKQQLIASYGTPSISSDGDSGNVISLTRLSNRGRLVADSQSFRLDSSTVENLAIRRFNSLIVA